MPNCQIVGDDLFVSNPERIKYGLQTNAADAVLLKVNQIGTVTEALQAADVASNGGLALFTSLRSHDTNDSFIVDFAVAIQAGA